MEPQKQIEDATLCELDSEALMVFAEELRRQNDALQARVKELEAWKAQALAVEAEWDPQAVARALDIPLGASIRACILPGIQGLQAHMKELGKALTASEAWRQDAALGLGESRNKRIAELERWQWDNMKKWLGILGWGCMTPTQEECLILIDAALESSMLQNRVSEWQEDTFGFAQTIPGIDAHLVKEFRELLEATTEEAQREECADILILLMGRAHKMGFDLLTETERKLAINRKRTWGQPDAQGVIEHTRS